MTDRHRRLVAYGAHVLAEHRRRCRLNGVTMPAELEALALLLACEGQPAPKLAGDGLHGEPLAVTYSTAAEMMAVSPRTVKRLTASGALPVVDIGGCRRVAVADLRAYVARDGRAAAG